MIRRHACSEKRLQDKREDNECQGTVLVKIVEGNKPVDQLRKRPDLSRKIEQFIAIEIVITGDPPIETDKVEDQQDRYACQFLRG